MGIMIEDKIVLKKPSEIKPYIRNPRRNDKTVELLCKIIPKVGFNVPLVIDEKGIIVKGHARFSAAIRLGMEEIPCIITHADEEAIKADRITDNKISEFSEWVNEEVLHELDAIDFDFDFSELGFPTVKFDDLPQFDQLEEKVSDEERQKLYEEFMASSSRGGEMDKEELNKAIEKAEKAQKEIPQRPRYYKCVCEKCGHVMFVKASEIASFVG